MDWIYDKHTKKYNIINNGVFCALEIRVNKKVFELWNICETEESKEYYLYCKIFANTRLYVVKRIAESIYLAGKYKANTI